MPTRLQPIRAIEWVLVVSTIVQSVYVFSPLYVNSIAANGATAFTMAVAGPAAVYVYTAVMVFAAFLLGIGIVKEKPAWRGTGLFIQGLCRLFNVLTVILFSGVFPLTWMYHATVVAVCVILWAATRIEVKYGV